MVKPLKFIAVLLISLGGGAGYSIAQTALYSPADQYELQARFYIAGDNRTGSYLIRNPGQRHLFGFPIEPMTEFDSRSATYPDFTKTMITYLRDEAAWAVVIDKFPVVAPPIKLAKSSYDLLNDISKNPHDPHTKLKALRLGVAIGAAVVAPELVILLEAAGVLIEHAEKVGSLARSQVMANRARAQIRLPVGVQQQANATLTETIGMRDGTFEMKGDRFQAEGSWKLEHSEVGARSELYARYDFKKFYMPNGSVISTIGTGNNYTKQVREEYRRGGSRVTTTTHSSYRVTRDGAALSKAVDVYDRTKVWDADSTVGKFSREHQADQSRASAFYPGTAPKIELPDRIEEDRKVYKFFDWLPIGWFKWPGGGSDDDEPPGGGGGSSNGGPPAPPPGGALYPLEPPPGAGGSANTASFSNVSSGALPLQNHRLSSLIQPGGVLLDAKNLITVENSKFADTLGARAMEETKGRAKMSEIVIGGKKYVVARAFSTTLPTKNDTRKQNQSLVQRQTPQIIGRYVDSPVDLVVKRGGQLALYIQRFYDSTTTRSDGRANHWSWQPYELLIGYKPQQNNKNKQAADTIVLFDRAASLELFYRRDKTKFDSKMGVALNPDLVFYNGYTRANQPKLLRQPSGDYLVQFPHGFNIGFNRDGKLLWQAHNQSSQIHYQYFNGKLTSLKKDSVKIIFKYNANGRLESAQGSNGKMVRYQYDGEGRLFQVNSGSFGNLQYIYSKAGRLTEVKASSDAKTWYLITRNSYDSRGRMLSHESSDGAWRFEYDNKQARVSVTDWKDITTRYYYDSAKRLVGYGQSDDDMILLNYGHQGQLLQVAQAKLANKSSTSGKPVFQVTKLLTPLAN